MPDNKKNSNEDINSVIDSAALEDLREKYQVPGLEEVSGLPAQNNSKIDPPPLTAPGSSDGTGSNSFSDPSGLSDTYYSEIQLELDELNSTLKTLREPISETPGNPVSPQQLSKEASLTQEDDTVPAVSVSEDVPHDNDISSAKESAGNEPADEQGKKISQSNPNNPVNDYMSSLRIIYEAPEESFNDTPKASQPVPVSVGKTAVAAETPASQKSPQPGSSVQPSSLSEVLNKNMNEASAKTKFAAGSPAGLLPDKPTGSKKSKTKGFFKRFLKSVFPAKGDSIFEIIRKTVLILALITILICCALLLNTYIIEPYQNDLQSQKEIVLKINSQAVDEWSAVKEKYPGVVFPPGMQLKFAELYVVNNDFAGWLEIPGSGIDVPIVHAQDNSVYLKKTFQGETSKYGCCFVDAGNSIAELDRNTIIYGHNMRYGDQLFGDLENYKEIKGFQAAPLITFNTLFKDTKWKIYSVFITNSVESDDNGYIFNYIFKNLSSDEYFNTYVNQIDQRKLYMTGVDILPSDKILTLSTCCYDFEDARLVVVARMVRDGESENVDTSKAVLNSSPRYPQVWYTAKKISNPYKDAEKWFAG